MAQYVADAEGRLNQPADHSDRRRDGKQGSKEPTTGSGTHCLFSTKGDVRHHYKNYSDSPHDGAVTRLRHFTEASVRGSAFIDCVELRMNSEERCLKSVMS